MKVLTYTRVEWHMILKPFIPSHPTTTFPMSRHLTVTFLLFRQDEGNKCLCAFLLTNKQRNFINNGKRFCLKLRKCWYKPSDGRWSQAQKAAYLLITVSIESTTAEERTHFSSSRRKGVSSVVFRVLWRRKHSNKYLKRQSPWPFSNSWWAQGSSLSTPSLTTLP